MIVDYFVESDDYQFGTENNLIKAMLKNDLRQPLIIRRINANIDDYPTLHIDNKKGYVEITFDDNNEIAELVLAEDSGHKEYQKAFVDYVLTAKETFLLVHDHINDNYDNFMKILLESLTQPKLGFDFILYMED